MLILSNLTQFNYMRKVRFNLRKMVKKITGLEVTRQDTREAVRAGFYYNCDVKQSKFGYVNTYIQVLRTCVEQESGRHIPQQNRTEKKLKKHLQI
jgi:hypothetical protein